MILTKKKKLAMLVMERKMIKETNQTHGGGMGQFMRRVISNVTDGLGFANESKILKHACLPDPIILISYHCLPFI